MFRPKQQHMAHLAGPESRMMPDWSKLADIPVNLMGPNGALPDQANGYEAAEDLDAITRRQLIEDISAYRYDMEVCKSQMSAQDLTTEEARTLQMRLLDCGHQIRHCQHRIERLDAQTRLGLTSGSVRPQLYAKRSSSIADQPVGVKRQRISKFDKSMGDDSLQVASASGSGAMAGESGNGSTTAIQRLGYWQCRLCISSKYVKAGPQRVPSTPCKWPLKDVSKMMNHFLDLHTEQNPEDRCRELGDALARNRGPFEYWLTRTKNMELHDMSDLEKYIFALQNGMLPSELRELNRAAAAFPNSTNVTNELI